MSKELNKLPAIQSFKTFCREAGISAVSGWRWRQKGYVKTINICGRPYITAQEVASFLTRAAAGEFECKPTLPRRAAAPEA